MRSSAIRTFSKLLGVSVSALVVAAPVAYAATGNFDDGNKTVGTSFTREAQELFCGASSGCYFDAHHPLDGTCTKTASARLRFQRDAQPDLTEAEQDNYTSCNNYYWDNFRSGDNHGHHQDARVSSGTGVVHFYYTDTH